MPRKVDRESRRRDVIHAVWRIILTGGMSQASFRAVADETGLAIGSIRHFFGSHEDLIAAAAQELSDRVEKRILAVDTTKPGKQLAQDVLEPILPLDQEGHDEAIIWLTILVEARLNPALAAPARKLFDGVGQIVRLVLAHTKHADDEVEIERMCALLDGLATRAVVRPDVVRPCRIRAVLERHLASL